MQRLYIIAMRPRPAFWLANVLLILLYAWTLTESATVAIHIDGGRCTAIVGVRHSTIPCPNLAGGTAGFYHEDAEAGFIGQMTGCGLAAAVAPQHWCAPVGVRLQISGGVGPDCLFPADEACVLGTAGEMDVAGGVTVIGRLQRPADPIGIVLLPPDSATGWAFLLNGEQRQGVWWRWRDGQPDTPIQGIPFDKTFVAQGQSLLRDILITHQGAFLLFLVYWSMGVLVYWFTRLINRQYTTTPLHHYTFARFATLREQWIVLTLAFLAYGASLPIASNVLERVPHVQDSVTYLFQAQTLARGRLWAPAPELPEFFEQEFLIVYPGGETATTNRWFGKYPPGYPLLLAAGVIGGAPWLINPLLAALTVPLLYLLGKSLYHRGTGLLAAVLALTSPFFLFLSGSLMSHAAELFWTTLFMVAWVQAVPRFGDVPRLGKSRYMAAVAGIALGMLLLTRQATAASLAVVFGFGCIAIWQIAPRWQIARRDVALGTTSACNVSPAARRLLTRAGLTALPFLLLLPAYQWALTGDPWQDPRTLYWPFDRPGFGQDIGEGNNVFTLVETEAGTAVQWLHDPAQPLRGHTPARGLFNTGRNLEALLPHLFGWPPLLTLAFIWLAFLLRRPQPRDWLLLAVIAAQIAVHVAYWADGIMYGPRYWYATLPALLLLTARGIEATAVYSGEWRVMSGERRPITAYRLPLTIILLTLLIAANLLVYLPTAVDAYHDYNFVSGTPLAQVEATIKGRALIFIANHRPDWWTYGQFFSGNNPWLDGRLLYVRDLGQENGRLMALYPDQPAYLWQDGQIISLKPSPHAVRPRPSPQSHKSPSPAQQLPGATPRHPPRPAENRPPPPP